jgi:hypothetical protein
MIMIEVQELEVMVQVLEVLLHHPVVQVIPEIEGKVSN